MAMFSCFNFPGEASEKEAKIEAYIAALNDLSAQEILTVCRKAMHGEIGSGKFLPTAAELYQAARPRTRAKADKPSPDWRPGQDRFLSSDGTLYISEGGRTLVYTAEELREFGYALPAPPLNRDDLIARGVDPLKRIGSPEPGSVDKRINELIKDAVKKF